MCWIVINCTLRFALTLMMVLAIVKFEHWWSLGERYGMAMIGSAIFLTIPVIIVAGKEDTPFDDWASSLTALGMVVFFFFMLRRKWHHDLANMRSVKAAEAHLKSRGKI